MAGLKEKPVKFVQHGLDHLGCATARLAVSRGMKIAGAVDLSPERDSMDAGKLIGIGSTLLHVTDYTKGVLAKAKPGVMFHSTTLPFSDCVGVIQDAVEEGTSVISTCPDLAFPSTPEAKRLGQMVDRLAKDDGACVVSVGNITTYAMAALPLSLTGACQKVDGIRVTRVVDAAKLGFDQAQKQFGVGLRQGEFKARRPRPDDGLKEAAALLCDGLGIAAERISETTTAVLARKYYEIALTPVRPGEVAGTRREARAVRKGKAVATLELTTCIGAERVRDEIFIDGTPRIHSVFEGGLVAAAVMPAVIVNLVPAVLKEARLSPGIKTLNDFIAPASRSGQMK